MLVGLGGQRFPQGHRVIGGPLGHKQPGMVAGHDVAVVDAVGQELGEEVGQGQRLLGRTGRRIFITLQTGRPTTPQPQPTTPQPQPTAPRLRISVPCCTTNHHPSAADCLGPGGPVRYCRLPALLPVQSPAISPRCYRLPAPLPAHPPATACAARPLYDQLHRASCCCDSCQSARAVTSRKPGCRPVPAALLRRDCLRLPGYAAAACLALRVSTLAVCPQLAVCLQLAVCPQRSSYNSALPTARSS